MYHLWRMSQAYQRRPSELLGITDSWVAWQVDSAVHAGGSAVDAEVDRAVAEESEKKQPRLERAVRGALERVLGIEDRRRRAAARVPRRTWRYDPQAWADGGQLVPVRQEAG